MGESLIKNKKIGVLLFEKKSEKEFNNLNLNFASSQDFDLLKLDKTFFSPQEHNSWYLTFHTVLRRAHNFLHIILVWINRNSSLNYKLKAYNIYGTNRQVKENKSFIAYQNHRASFSKRLIVRVFANPLGLYLVNGLVKLLFRIKKKNDHISIENLDKLILMYGARISLEFDYYLWLAKKRSIESIAIQENWDNLSSKIVLYQHPDIFLTWGLQSSMHLRQIHNYRGLVVEAGCARIREFYLNREDQTNRFDSIDSPKNILLIGTGDGEYDLLIAKQCLSILNRNSILSEFNYKIVYRPHPYSLKLNKNINDFGKLKDISIDNPAIHNTNHHRIKMIKNSAVIISLYSTVLLEASILNKPCVVPSFVESAWIYGPAKYLDEGAHYLGMSALENFYNIDSEDKFVDLLVNLAINKVNCSNKYSLLNWYCKDIDSSRVVRDLLNRWVNNVP